MNGLKWPHRVAATVLAALLTQSSHANLVSNGGFEDTLVRGGNSGWQWFTSDLVTGWSGDNIELWRDFGGIGPYEGDQHAELNAHPNDGTSFSIYQTIDTLPGQDYEVRFAYGARKSANEVFSVEFANQQVVLDDHAVNQWSLFTRTFTASDYKSDLRFTSMTPLSGTVGNFLDDVRVTAASGQVDAPSTPLLIGSCLLALHLMRRYSRNNPRYAYNVAGMRRSLLRAT